jgi:hypothetical protein
MSPKTVSMFRYIFVILVFLLGISQIDAIAGENKANSPMWEKSNVEKPVNRERKQLTPEKYLVFRLNRKLLNGVFSEAPLEFTSEAQQTETILEIPNPEGGVSRFRIEESPMLAPQIASQFPTWKQYSGQGIDDPTAIARFDVNANGFHGYILSSKGTILIDPISLVDQKNYLVYYKGDIGESNRDQFSCDFLEGSKEDKGNFFAPQAFSNGTQLRTYRLAISATKEYTNFFGGNVTTAFAAVTTTVNRMIGIYRRDLASTFVLVTGTTHMFTDANDGGFPAASDPNVSTLSLPRNQVVMDSGNGGNPVAVGNANYDIGHVLSRTGNPNGLASSPSLCNNSAKAQGFTGAQTPQGDGFDVDYVAHEIGHQFGMSHTFNNDIDGSCDTRSATSAYEPASGVTIMGYGGICAPRNLSKNSIEYFNLRSFDQSLKWFADIAGGVFGGIDPACGMPTANGNNVPVVTSPGNFTIPKLTPFTLTASATDTNGDALTYLWEEFDLGGATRSAAAIDTDEDGTARPIFRAYNASASGSRTFPSLTYILNNANVVPLTYTGTLPFAPVMGSTNGYVCDPMETCVTGERLPSIARVMNFRVTVRDNRAGGGAIVDGQSAITVDAASGPFRISNQNSVPNTGGSDFAPSASWQAGTMQAVTWDVANTNAAPVSAANVKISLSTDGGQTFPTVLLASTPNDGTENITVPNSPTTTARIKIEAVGNVFFDVNDANFTITAPTAASANVSGRVTTSGGKGIPRAAVSYTDQEGNTRFAYSNPFGYFRFSGLDVGQTYTFRVQNKRYVFTPQIINLNDNIDSLNFIAQP